jgi:hypothetical protein
MIKPSNRFKFLFWFFITLTDTIIQNHNNLHNHHHNNLHHMHLNHQNNSTDSEDSKMQTDHNGSNGGQLQYITLGNNIPVTSATTPTSDSKGTNNHFYREHLRLIEFRVQFVMIYLDLSKFSIEFHIIQYLLTLLVL